MNELVRTLGAKALEHDPSLEGIFDEFDAAQQELVQLLDFMGVRHVAVEIPPAGNADATFHANVSGTGR